MVSLTTVTWYSQLCAIILAIGIFALGILIGVQLGERAPVPVTQEVERPAFSKDVALVSGFTWVHTIDESGDVPKSTVSVRITKDDGTSEEKQIATVDGSCNEMPVETPLALGSAQLLCYYAGFGYQYRVIARDEGYAVQQKEIEEASPDYNPPIAPFVTVLTIASSGEVWAQ